MKFLSNILIGCALLLMGTVAGLFLYQTYGYYTYSQARAEVEPVDLRRLVLGTTKTESLENDTIDHTSAALFGIAKIRTNTNLEKSGFYSQSDVIATAVAVTSDGWIVTSAQLISDYHSFVVLTPERIAVPISQYLVDSLTGLSFIKIDQDISSVIDFVGSSNIVYGTQYYGLSYNISHEPITPLAIKNRSYSDDSSTPHSSTLLSKRYFLSHSMLPGSVIVNNAGALVGLADTDLDKSEMAIPADYIKNSLENVLKYNSFTQRVDLVVSFIHLASIGNNKDSIYSKGEGDYIVSVKSNKNSKSTKITQDDIILAGDIVLSVDGIKIDSNYDISEILATYRAGDVVRVVLKRDGVILEKNLSL